MELMQLYENVKMHVSENNIKESLSNLEKLTNELISNSFEPELTLLKSKYKEIRKDEIRGTIHQQEISIRYAQLKYGILNLADMEMEFQKNNKEKLESQLLIKKVHPIEKIELIYWQRSTNEKYDIEVNPNLPAKLVAKNILLSFEPDFENSILFKQGRVNIILVKVGMDSEVRMKMELNLISNGIVQNDTIAIEYDISNKNRYVTVIGHGG